MANYNRNFKENRTRIESMITHGIPEMAKALEKKNLITAEDKYQILELKSAQRVIKLLGIIENKYCYKEFIAILNECGLKDCADIIKGDAEVGEKNEEPEIPITGMRISDDSARLESDLQRARDHNTQLLSVISKLEREKEALMLSIRYLQVDLDSMQRRDKSFQYKCKELDQTKIKLKEVEEKLKQVESEDFTKSTYLHGELNETKKEVKSLRNEMKEQNIRIESKIDQLLNHFPQTTGRTSAQVVRQSSALCPTLPPIKKGK